MQWIKSFQLFEKIEQDIKLNLKISYDNLIKSSSLVELDYKSIFKTYQPDLETLVESPEFLADTLERDLVASQIHDSKKQSNLLDTEIKYVFLYSINDDETNIEEPVYILIQQQNKEIKLYYTTEDLNRFHEKLSSRIIKVTVRHNNKEWIYVTNNAGVNWLLQNLENETDRFTKEMSGEILTNLKNENKIKIEVTNK